VEQFDEAMAYPEPMLPLSGIRRRGAVNNLRIATVDDSGSDAATVPPCDVNCVQIDRTQEAANAGCRRDRRADDYISYL
jgi:hypothetical protein